jgi:hypothetical protein
LSSPLQNRTLDVSTLKLAKGMSLFSLAPQMDYVPSIETQDAVLNALKVKSPHFKAQFKRFSSRAFKRLSLNDAEALMLDLVRDAYLADVLHLHLDWFCYLGRFSQHQAMGLWMHLFQLFRDKPLLLFGHEVPTFLSNPLMVKERTLWQQWCEHFSEMSRHYLLLHQPSMKQAWLDVGFPEEKLLILPKLLHLEEKQTTFPIQPQLFHLVKQRFKLTQKQQNPPASKAPYIVGFIPSDEDNDSIPRLKEALLNLPNNVVLLVMGGSHAHRPAFRWEQALLEAIATHDLGHRVLMTGAVQAEEEATYLNVCDVDYVAHRHQSDDLQDVLYKVLKAGKTLFLPAESETVQGLALLFQEAWQASVPTSIASSQGLLEACLLHMDEIRFLNNNGLVQAMSLEAVAERYLTLYETLLSSQQCKL